MGLMFKTKNVTSTAQELDILVTQRNITEQREILVKKRGIERLCYSMKQYIDYITDVISKKGKIDEYY